MLAAAATDPRRSPTLVARAVFTELAMCLLAPQVRTVSRQRRLPLLEPGRVVIRIGASDPSEVAWDTNQIMVVAGDPLTEARGVSVVESIDRLYEVLVDRALSSIEPLIEAVRRRVRVGRKGLWGVVVDFFANSQSPIPLRL
jgi:hypothetical protein